MYDMRESPNNRSEEDTVAVEPGNYHRKIQWPRNSTNELLRHHPLMMMWIAAQ